MQKQISTITGIAIILVATAVLFGGIFCASTVFNPKIKYQNDNVKSQNETTDWKTFDSGDGFEFKYPVLNSFIAFKEPSIVHSNSNINNDGCYLGHENAIIPPNPISEKKKSTINNINFCISQTSDSAMGHSYPTYLYTTTYKNSTRNHFTIILPFDVTACNNLKGGSNYRLCQYFFSNSANNIDGIVDSIISTIKFF